jgi:hypothetical protein
MMTGISPVGIAGCGTADRHERLPQPAMAGVGIETRVPHRADRQFRRPHRQVECLEVMRFHPSRPHAQARHERAQIRTSGGVERIKKARHDRNDVTPEMKLGQRVVDRSLPGATTRRDDVAAGGVERRGDRAGQQGLIEARRTDEAVAEDELAAHFRRRDPRCADLKIDHALAQSDPAGHERQLRHWQAELRKHRVADEPAAGAARHHDGVCGSQGPRQRLHVEISEWGAPARTAAPSGIVAKLASVPLRMSPAPASH